MNKYRVIFMVLCGWLCHVMSFAQPLCRVVQYNEEDGVPSSHVAQLLQDEDGLMWFATWNGLCRFDGYDFKTFKPQVGDGCQMVTDRIRNITLLPTGNILCQVDLDHFMFDRQTYRFRDLTEAEKEKTAEWERKYLQSRSLLNGKRFVWTDHQKTHWTLQGNGHLSYTDPTTGREVDYPLPLTFRTLTFALVDKRGHLWALDYGNIYHFRTDMQRTSRIAMEPQAEVKCLFNDQQGRYWVATKEDKAVRIYHGQNDQLIGYLGSDGRLHQPYTSFGAAVYCMLQTADGTLWLGTKPDGLFRLRPNGDGFVVSHLAGVPFHDIYHLQEDPMGRLWVAALDGGLCYTSNPHDEHPVFKVPTHYPKECQRARYMHVSHDGILLTATSNGLLVARLERHADQMRFKLHQRKPDDRQSLSCSATMDVVQDSQGRYLVSTESGGVNQITTSNLLSDTLSFRHIRNQFHVQSNDIALSLTPISGDRMMAVGSHLITLLDSTTHGRVLDVCNFNEDYRFSEAHPLALQGGRWLFGLTDGACMITEQQLTRQAYHPQLVLTALTVQGGASDWTIGHRDSLTLAPHERNITVHFSAIDYAASEHISYAFRLLDDNHDETTPWNYIGHDRSATLLDLMPGTYRLEMRSTNADGEWIDNTRQLTIVVTPTFWESVCGRLLLLVLLCGTLAAIIYTILYIRRIKRQQRETLEKYLALIEVRGKREEVRGEEEDDPMLHRVMAYVEANLSNSDANVGDMALAAATSRSGLQRKLKQAMGITPQDLLREARIKRACQLLRTTDKNIADIAYACGFTDPKYFSRSFKQSTGMSPTEYKNASN